MGQKSSLFIFHAYCIVHPDANVRQLYIKNKLQLHQIHVFDTLILDDTPSISIAQVKTILPFLSRKAVMSKSKTVTIKGDKLSPVAQQALLKILEEPPQNSTIFIEVSTLEILLPTIISRCHVIYLMDKPVTNYESFHEFWNKTLTLTPGERLRDASLLDSDRNESISWVKSQIFYFRYLLFEKGVNQNDQSLSLSLISISRILKTLLASYKLLKQNISTRLVLDHLFLQIPGK